MYATITVKEQNIEWTTEDKSSGSEPMVVNGKYRGPTNTLKTVKRLLKKQGVTEWETHREEVCILSWDTSELDEEGDFDFFWDDFKYQFNSIVSEVFNEIQEVAMTCPAFGWRRVPGGKMVQLGDDPLNNIMSAMGDFEKTIRVYKCKDSTHGVHIKMLISHHDSPTGDTFYVYRKKYLTGVDKRNLAG